MAPNDNLHKKCDQGVVNQQITNAKAPRRRLDLALRRELASDGEAERCRLHRGSQHQWKEPTISIEHAILFWQETVQGQRKQHEGRVDADVEWHRLLKDVGVDGQLFGGEDLALGALLVVRRWRRLRIPHRPVFFVEVFDAGP